MSESYVQGLVTSGLAGIDFSRFSPGQIIDFFRHMLSGVIDNAKKEAGGEEGLEDLVLMVAKRVFDVWAASNRFPAWVDGLIWQVVERSVRAAI